MQNSLPNDNCTQLKENFTLTRKYSLKLCEQLSDEDLQAQSMTEASPLKWHLAHTTWAFEAFVLKPFLNNYEVFDTSYDYLFNSYYNAIGEQFPRSQRGLLTRPDRNTVIKYRQHVDKSMMQLMAMAQARGESFESAFIKQIKLTINHEQQHQELMLTDLKHLLSINPTFPFYVEIEQTEPCESGEPVFFEEGLYPIGHQNESFYFDNEGPPHLFYLAAFKLSPRLVSNGEYIKFIEDNGYSTPAYWLSEAWQKLNKTGRRQPYYWLKQNGFWYEYTLGGLKLIEPGDPVKHVSYFEASAFACWKGRRLPTEQEWETAARSQNPSLKQMFTQLWQWTTSSYSAYPGYKPAKGAIGEYNGKFMVSQYVLRGGSIATPQGHIRPSYRNFFYPDAFWQFSGIRLAESI